MIAAIGNTPYNVALLIHILSAMAAFAPLFVHPLLSGQTKDLGDGHRSVVGFMAGNGRRIYAPGLIVSGLAGFALSGMSSGTYALSQTWLLAAAILWVGMNGILHAVVIPGSRAVAEGDDAAESKVSLGNTLLSVALVLMVFLMVFKPGF